MALARDGAARGRTLGRWGTLAAALSTTSHYRTFGHATWPLSGIKPRWGRGAFFPPAKHMILICRLAETDEVEIDALEQPAGLNTHQLLNTAMTPPGGGQSCHSLPLGDIHTYTIRLITCNNFSPGSWYGTW